jgi:hypothetical protein
MHEVDIGTGVDPCNSEEPRSGLEAFVKLVMLLIGLSAALPAYGESPLYTNKDLGRHIKSSPVRVSPEEAAAIMAAHQPVFAREEAPAGPRVFIMNARPEDGPFGPLLPFGPPTRLDGTPLSQPPDQYGEPFGWFGAGPRQTRGSSHRPRPPHGPGARPRVRR